jgi:putative alpha-1,2-mannosidase
VFGHAAIRLPNGKSFTLDAKDNSKDNKYIQSIKLNGKPLDRLWLRHAEIANGGKLELEMGNTPNRSLGVAPETLPPSSAAINPQTFAAP